MAAFSYQYHPFLFDPVLCPPDSAFKFSGFGAEGQINATTMTTTNCFSQIYPSEIPHHQQVSVDVRGVHESSCLSSKVSLVDNEPSVTTKTQTPESSSVMDKPDSGEQVNQKMGNKRKSRAFNSAQSKIICFQDGKEGKDKKQRCNGGLSIVEDKMTKTDEKNQKEGPEEKGYIHVRARRGQATDSHSLAERVRRERISERMKLLQAIVPGCDKITGKALMLDEIINYVQSLQHQVEFLSMKLASLNPMFYDFGMDIDAMTIRQETSISLPSSALPSEQQISPTQPQPTSFLDNVSTNFTINEYSLPESSILLQQQRPNDYSQDNGSLLWSLEDGQNQKLINQFGLTKGMCSFH